MFPYSIWYFLLYANGFAFLYSLHLDGITFLLNSQRELNSARLCMNPYSCYLFNCLSSPTSTSALQNINKNACIFSIAHERLIRFKSVTLSLYACIISSGYHCKSKGAQGEKSSHFGRKGSVLGYFIAAVTLASPHDIIP